MKIEQLFLKPIDRDIEGVIHADDLESLKIEVEEYVITNEISRNLTDLMEEYKKPNHSNNGVWISGFFGSGKSHLLKMLALLLEKRQIIGFDVVETMLSKIPDSDAMLKAEIRKAVAIPSKSVLFNIDQKADAITKGASDAVLGVFARVFDEFCGYYGQQGYIAKFERDLDSQGHLETFKEKIFEVTQKSWHEVREAYNSHRQVISKAYAAVTGNSAESTEDIIKSYREDYHLSIADFAENVNQYIQRQPKGFRLNFFVDEVGQYVAENIKLMTNLQTVAESLATICNGQSWLFVTSQEDMSTVLGEFEDRQGNDFSKIKGRFNCQLHLTSQDVAEVIRERLLKKNDAGVVEAKKHYVREHQNFGTLFTFPDGGMAFRNFRDESDFVASYPFIPYQYTLFQQAIEALSKHNAFTGKHQSVGERSMLGVFQDVVMAIQGQESGVLGTFDLMFEGIRDSIKAGNLRAILNAEEHLDNKFAIKVLKALFMVKYVRSYRATARNLRVLMQTHFNENIKALESSIIDALALLERETYIQRTDDIYEYLTEEEQDVTTEIKNVPVDNEEILKTLEDLFFAEVIHESKIRYEDNQQDYSFAKAIDEKLRGRERELVIDLITPSNTFNENLVALKAHSMGKAELMVVMPSDNKFFDDLLMYKRTESYIRQNHGQATSELRNMILSVKATQNSERKKSLSQKFIELLARAKFIISGDEVELGGEDARTRIIKAFNLLIAKIYPNLRMLGSANYSEADIHRYLDTSNMSLFEHDAAPLNEAEMEVLTFIRNNRTGGERTTMKKIEERFSTRPYGWYLAAIQCVVAMLAGRGSLECWSDGTLLENSKLEHALRNTQGFSNLILEPRATPPPEKVQAMKNFYSDFFNAPCGDTDARAIVKNIKNRLGELHTKLDEQYRIRSRYPFLSTLKPILDRLAGFIKQDFDYFLGADAASDFAELLDLKESEIDPVITFFSGSKREIYDDLAAFFQEKGPDLTSDDQEKLSGFLNDVQIHKSNHLQVAKVDLEDIQHKTGQRLEAERKSALEKIDQLQQNTHNIALYQKLPDDAKQQVDQSFDHVGEVLRQQALAVSIRDKVSKYTVETYPDLLTEMSRLVIDAKGTEKEDTETKTPTPATFVHIQQVQVSIDRKILETAEDAKAYCLALEKALLAEIKNNKHINI